MKRGILLMCGIGAGAAVTALFTTARGKRLRKRLTQKRPRPAVASGKNEEFIELIAREFYNV